MLTVEMCGNNFWHTILPFPIEHEQFQLLKWKYAKTPENDVAYISEILKDEWF